MKDVLNLITINLGQLDQIASEIYNLELKTDIVKSENTSIGGRNVIIVTFRLNFDNTQYVSNSPLVSSSDYLR